MIADRSHVHVALELKYPTSGRPYSSLLGKFGPHGHIDWTIPVHLANPQWVMDDARVHSWLLRFIAPDIQGLAIDGEQSARQLWVAIKGLFLPNKEPHDVFLHEEFSSMRQGDLSINDYCQCMKTVTYALSDVGHAISPSQLVLNLLRVSTHTSPAW